MKLKPLEQWICDICGGIIQSKNEGSLVFKSGKDAQTNENREYDFKIVHTEKCRSITDSSLELEYYLGQEGQNYFFSHLSYGMIYSNLGGGSKKQVIYDFDEFVDVFRRLQLEYYEEARTYFTNPDVLDLYADNNEVGPYLLRNLKKIIEIGEKSIP